MGASQQQGEKDALNKYIYKCRLKDDKDDNCLTVTGRLFHARGHATEKLRSPAFVFVRGTIIDHKMPTGVLSDECSC